MKPGWLIFARSIHRIHARHCHRIRHGLLLKRREIAFREIHFRKTGFELMRHRYYMPRASVKFAELIHQPPF